MSLAWNIKNNYYSMDVPSKYVTEKKDEKANI